MKRMILSMGVVLGAVAACGAPGAWQMTVVTTNAQEAWGFPGMALDAQGQAGFVYRTPWEATPANIHAYYQAETGTGLFAAPVELATGDRGFFATLCYDGTQPHAVFHRAPSVGAGAGYFANTGGTWSSEIVVTNLEGHPREPISYNAGAPNVIVLGPSVNRAMNYFRLGTNGVFQWYNPGCPILLSGHDAPVQMAAGTDGRVRIVATGPGGGNDQVWLGTETAPGSALFSWEQAATGDVWASNVGFALDQNNCSYIAAKQQSSGLCVLLDNATGGWRVTQLGQIDADWPRTAVAIDPWTNVWVVYNGRDGANTRHVSLWGNEGGMWQTYPDITNSPAGDDSYYIQAMAGFGFAPDGTAKLGMIPQYNSKRIEYWYAAQLVTPQPPVFTVLDYSPAPTPVETRPVAAHATVSAPNAQVTNVTLVYTVNGGASHGPFAMTTNAGSAADYYYAVPAQATGTVVAFQAVAAANNGFVTTSAWAQYAVYQDLQWHTVVVTTEKGTGNDMPGMALGPDGLARVVCRNGAVGSMYYEEGGLGVFGAPVQIAGTNSGYVAGIACGTGGVVHVTLSVDGAGIAYVRRDGGVWSAPLVVISNPLSERRHVLALAGNAPAILFYEDGSFADGVLCRGNEAGTAFVSTNVTAPGYFPIPPNDLRRPFAMRGGTDGRLRIVLSGPGGGDDQLWYGVETAPAANSFVWESVALDDVYAEQLGFTLTAANEPVIALRNGTTNRAAVYWKTGGMWQQQLLDFQEFWNRSAVAVDVDGHLWAACNSANAWGSMLLNLWSTRSGTWQREQVITNGVFVETIAGFEITEDNVFKLAVNPDVNAGAAWYWYSTQFMIPEPGGLLACLLGWQWRRQRGRA